MNQSFMFNFIFQLPPFPSVCIFILFLLSRSVLGTVDPFYEACVPKTCGDDQIVKFPFFIQGQQKPFCGYPGFQLSCNNKGSPVLTWDNIDYIVHKIFYNNQSLRVSNAVVSDTIASCDNNNNKLPLFRNISLPEGRFTLVSNQTEVVLLYNCNSSLPGEFLHYKADDCENKTNAVLALYEDDPNLGNVSKECSARVLVPVEDYGDGDSGIGIREVVRQGFLLNWTASNCSVCETSGGKCGFNASTYLFKCYCTDRPHAQQCFPPTPCAIKGKGSNRFHFHGHCWLLATWVPCWAHFVYSPSKQANQHQHLLQKSASCSFSVL